MCIHPPSSAHESMVFSVDSSIMSGWAGARWEEFGTYRPFHTSMEIRSTSLGMWAATRNPGSSRPGGGRGRWKTSISRRLRLKGSTQIHLREFP